MYSYSHHSPINLQSFIAFNEKWNYESSRPALLAARTALQAASADIKRMKWPTVRLVIDRVHKHVLSASVVPGHENSVGKKLVMKRETTEISVRISVPM